MKTQTLYAEDFKEFINYLSVKDYEITMHDENNQLICNLENRNKELSVSISTLGKVIYATVFYKDVCICAIKCNSIVIIEKEDK